MKLLKNNDNIKILEDYQNEEPPINLSKLAKKLNLSIYGKSLNKDISGAILKTIDGNYIIYVNTDEPFRRQRFTVAHEIAHFILHKDEIDKQLKGNLTELKNGIMYRSKLSNIYETQANQLASEILIPIGKLKDYIINKKINNINELSDIFKVSKHAMQIRLRQGGNIFIKE